MTSRFYPGLIAVAVGVVLSTGLLLPYVAVAYRRRGELGPGRALLAFVALIYGLALVAYVLLPLPSDVARACADGGLPAQLRPLQVVDDIVAQGVSGPSGLLRNPAILQVGFNLLLFVPFGMFARHLFGRSIPAALALGLGASLVLELTQLTGDWFAYPCAYRLFDVDDLLVNTLGAGLGALVAPVLRLVPGQRVSAPASEPRPVTLGRRLLGMLCDLLAVVLLGPFLVVLMRAVDGDGNSLGAVARSATTQTLLLWLAPAIVQLLSVLSAGVTVGELLVRLRPEKVGVLHALIARPVRWATGIGGLCLLQVPTGHGWGAASGGLVLASLVGVLGTRRHRGLPYLFTGLELVDARLPVGAQELTTGGGAGTGDAT